MAERPNILDSLNNNELVQRYRFNREGILFIEELLREDIQPITRRGNGLSAQEKVLVTLRYLATGGIQLNDADIHNVSQPTISRCVNQVVNCLSTPEMVRRFVRFPNTRERCNEQAHEFFSVAGFPKVVAVVDGTHIRIKAPSEFEDQFVNRKGFHSVNVQIAFDAFYNIVDIVARWPGSTHDSRILQNSGLRQLFENGHMPGHYHLLGDNGYACKRWMLTPYLHPQPGAQEAYNRYFMYYDIINIRLSL